MLTYTVTMALSKEYRPNGTIKPSRVSRSDAGFRQASGYVAAIDFGTTYCSVAYTLQGSKEILKIPLDGTHTRVPNSILIERKSKKVSAFGFRAQHRFAQTKKKEEYILFERMKMILYRTENVDRSMPVSPINSCEEYYLVDVVAFILKYLKDQLYEALGRAGVNMKHVLFDWVVTVPAIWDIDGKQMMREAAYKAGLCSSPPSCALVLRDESSKSERPSVDDPDRLSLALEPEAAGLYCYNNRKHSKKPKHFTVLDIGGGTVDITSYCIDDDDHICEVDKASGNDWGGTRVNEEFMQFLESITDDPGCNRYISVGDPQLQELHKAEFNKLVYGDFETQKTIFGDDDEISAVINIPNTFVSFYQKEKLQAGIKSKYADVAELENCQLTIEPEQMKKFFQPAIDKIHECAVNAIERVKHGVKKLEAIYLVGGFGGCKFTKKIVQDTLQDRYGKELDVFVPIEHKMAVVCGAIIFRRNPEVIWARKAKATYGDIIAMPFNDDIHDTAHKIIDERGKCYCDDLFRAFTEIGDTIRADEVLQNTCIPFESKQTKVCFTVYSSDERDIWYARNADKKIAAELKSVGILVFDLTDIPGEDKYDKTVILTIDLSQTEIQLKAHHEKTGKEVKVVLDTL